MKRIQVLATGCAKCAKLKENAQAAIHQVGTEATVEKVEDINEITGFGVIRMLLPSGYCYSSPRASPSWR